MLLHPIVIFLTAWAISIVCYLLRLTDWMPDRPDLLGFVFLLSTTCFLLGFLAARGKRPPGRPIQPKEDLQVNLRRLRIIQLFLAILVVGITAYNVMTTGLPPALAQFVDVKSAYYMTFGRAKGVLFPTACVIFLCSLYERRLALRLAAMAFAIAALVTYTTREFLVVAILEAFFLYAVTRRLSDARIAAIVAVVVISIPPLMHVLGELRVGAGREAMIEAIEIRPIYRNVNTGVLWTVAYASEPTANMLAFIEHADKYLYGRICFDQMLPTFLQDARYTEYYYGLRPNPHNTACTYLGLIYLDFGFAGIAGINLALGVLGGVLSRPSLVRRYAMSYAIYLCMLALLYVTDYLLHFPFLMSMLLSVVVARMCLTPSPSGRTVAK